MTVFIFFGAAFFCILFLVLATLLKILTSIVDGLISSLTFFIIATFILIVSMLVLFGLFAFSEAVAENGIWIALLESLLVIVVAVIVGVVILAVGGTAFVVLYKVGEYVLGALKKALEWSAEHSENAYLFFLKSIDKRIQKC